jgi:hypothetical protein
MFRALLAYPQEALHKRQFVYCVRKCQLAVARLHAVSLQSCYSQLTMYAPNIPNAACVAPPEDEQVMVEACRGP